MNGKNILSMGKVVKNGCKIWECKHVLSKSNCYINVHPRNILAWVLAL